MTSSPTTNPSNISLGDHPLIWGNIALLAGVPWLLALSMAGLAVGDPVFPAWFEIFLLGFPAIAIVTWVQWQQPVSPFSLWFVAKPSESLSEPERQILTLVKQHRNGWYVTGWIAVVVAIAMIAIFCKLYLAAPLAQIIAPFPASLRLFGIIWAEIFFLLSNILAQSGISALRIKLTAESDLKGLQPFAVEKIKNNFTNIGWNSPQLLKFFEEEAIGEVTNDLPKVEIAAEAADQFPDVKEDPEQETEETEPSNIEITSTFEPTELSSELQIETIVDEEIVQESEVADVSLDDQLVEEVDELEISAIVAEESVLETIAEPEIEQIFAEPQIESVLNQELDQEITQEPEQLNPFAADDFIGEAVPVETDLGITDTASESIIEDPEIENIVEEADELVAFETDEDPELTFLEIPDSRSEATLEETEQADASLDPTDSFLDEQLAEDNQELESLETVEDSGVELVADTATTNDDKRGLDFLKKSRKTGGLPKKHGFGKAIKRDHLPISESEIVEPEPVKVLDLDIEAIAAPIEPELESIETQDFDEELDELIAFNTYVENILKEYLEDDDEESEDFDNNLEAVQIIEATPELEIESNVEQSLTEERASNDQKIQDAKYLVQEFLVDKFFARLEELNNADKANHEQEQLQENPSEVDPEIDEFADLEALLDRKPLQQNTDTEDLRDRNS